MLPILPLTDVVMPETWLVSRTRGSWDIHLMLIEFTYNNSFHASIGMAPHEALYGRTYRTSLCWYESCERVVLKPEIVQDMNEKIKMIQERMKASQSRQKSYYDQRRKEIEFQKDDHVFFKSYSGDWFW